MKFDYLNELPEGIEIWNKNRYVDTIIEWEKTDSKVIRLICKNPAEKNACRASVSAYIKNHNLDWTVYNEKNKYNIYVVRA